jgi:hypothetical protein
MAYCKLICTNAAPYSSPYFDTSQRLIRLISGNEKYLCFDIVTDCCVPTLPSEDITLLDFRCDFMRSDVISTFIHEPYTISTLSYSIYDYDGVLQQGVKDISELTSFKIRVGALNPGKYEMQLTIDTSYSSVSTRFPMVVSG